MIVILNANPSFDRTLIVDEIKSTGVIRGKKVFKHPDGKGMGAARVLNLFKVDYMCLNILGGKTGSMIYDLATAENLNMRVFKIKNESRINTIVVDKKNNTLVINEPGPFVERKEIERFKIWIQSQIEKFKLSDEDNYFIVGGSFPRGFTRQDFEDILSFVHKNSFKVVIDISKEFLKVALEQHVWMIKVNLHEISDLIPAKNEEIISFVHENYRVENIIITAGRSGSFGRFLGMNFKTIISKSEKRYAVGSGDAYLGGIMYGIANHFKPSSIIKIAAACGAANTEEIGPCVFEKEHVEKWLNLITVREVDIR